MSGEIQFGALDAKNIGPFESLSISLRDRGLLLILGDNRDTTAADNNGSGKSHVMKGVTWCLWGETPEGDKVDKLTRNGADFIWTRTSWTDDDGEWAVTRSKDRKSSVKLELEHNSQDVSAPTVALTQLEIAKRLGMDFATWRNTVLYAQGDIVRFADPGTTDAERKLILKRILRLDVLDKANESARAKLKRIDTEQTQLTQEAGGILAELRGLEASGDLQDQLDAAEQEVKQHQTKAAKLAKLRELEAGVKEALDEIRARLTDAEEATKEATKYQLAAVTASSHAKQVRSEIQQDQRQLASVAQREQQARWDLDKELKRIANFIAAGKCTACGTKTTAPSVKAHTSAEREQAEQLYQDTIESLGIEREQLAGAIAAAEAAEGEALAEAKAALESAAAAKARGEAIKSEVNTESSAWYTKLNTIQRDITLSEQALVQASAARKRADGFRQKLKGINERRSTLEARGLEIATSSDALTAERLHVDFWVKGFSNAGLSSYMMDNIMPALSERANHYLDILADGDIQVSFDTQSKLKSGEAREKLSIGWLIEGEKDTTPSGGQRKKISIAVDLALMDIVATRERAAVDLLLMDEMLDGLDTTGRQRVMTLLAELRQKRSTIVVISHDASIAEMFEQTMTVRKMDRKAELLDDVT